MEWREDEDGFWHDVMVLLSLLSLPYFWSVLRWRSWRDVGCSHMLRALAHTLKETTTDREKRGKKGYVSTDGHVTKAKKMERFFIQANPHFKKGSTSHMLTHAFTSETIRISIYGQYIRSRKITTEIIQPNHVCTVRTVHVISQ